MPHEGAANWPHGGRTQHTASPWPHLVDVVVGGLDVNLALCSMGRVAGGVSGRAHCCPHRCHAGTIKSATTIGESLASQPT